jgi:hypothetical protein
VERLEASLARLGVDVCHQMGGSYGPIQHYTWLPDTSQP